jgi:spore coat protein A, manganese oxidase
MVLNRRELLKQAALSTLALRAWLAGSPTGQRAPLASRGKARAINPLQLEPFVDPMPIPQLLRSEGQRASPVHGVKNAPFFSITMREIRTKMHRDLAPTRLWSYGPEAIGPLVETRGHKDVLIEWHNQLPLRHFLPIDYSLHGSGRELPESRAVVHLHGGRTPTASDGYPENWYGPGKSRVCHYPNRQDAAMLWYHDHAMGTNRLNLYAGLVGVYLIRDSREESLGLPAGKYELPLILCDRNFDHDGQLVYPVSPYPEHPWVDEVVGDAMVVNGRVQPFHEVEPRRYRLRVLNAANARFFRLGLSNNASFQQIGADQGLLPAPVRLTTLLLAPGERADLVVDFASMRGEHVILTNGPFQMMQFRIGSTPVENKSRVSNVVLPVSRLPEASAARARELTLNEYKDPAGNAMVMLLNRALWQMPVTEIARLGSTEIWSFVNLTDDTHPIHLHHVRFQVLDRRSFDRDVYLLQNAVLRFTAAALAPRPNESGWKDVVQCPPNMVTRIHVSFDGYPGRHLWHCHLLEHEANSMMRPYDIVN